MHYSQRNHHNSKLYLDLAFDPNLTAGPSSLISDGDRKIVHYDMSEFFKFSSTHDRNMARIFLFLPTAAAALWRVWYRYSYYPFVKIIP
jgi:hypothetical protein